MNHQGEQIAKWQSRIWLVPSAYRLLAFAIAATWAFVLPWTPYSGVPLVALVAGVGVYSLLKASLPLRWHQAGILGYSLLIIDIAICVFVLILTGGLYSPFLVYTLTPLLTAALLLDIKVTFAIAGLSGVYVIGGTLANPFFRTQLSFPHVSHCLVYIMAVGTVGILPYLINVNLRQHLQSQNILQERQRLSREIHDGIAPSVSGLRWQIQLVRRRLIQMGIELDEVRALERLADKAFEDTRESLELLRSYTGDGSFLPHLRDYLKYLRQETSIDFRLDIGTDGLRLKGPVELELLRVCQEALTNIRKHSGARNVEVKIKPVNNHLAISIADDGRGFDALTYYREGMRAKGHGLEVMRERVESIGGKLCVLSMPGKGTEVLIDVPANSHGGRLSWRNR